MECWTPSGTCWSLLPELEATGSPPPIRSMWPRFSAWVRVISRSSSMWSSSTATLPFLDGFVSWRQRTRRIPRVTSQSAYPTRYSSFSLIQAPVTWTYQLRLTIILHISYSSVSSLDGKELRNKLQESDLILSYQRTRTTMKTNKKRVSITLRDSRGCKS